MNDQRSVHLTPDAQFRTPNSFFSSVAILLISLALFAGCSRNPMVPASGEFEFLDTWGKDYYTASRDIGPGHGDGTSGSEIGAFKSPTALAVHQTEIYVLDSGNSRIQKFSLSAGNAGAPVNFSFQTNGVEMNSLGSAGYSTYEFVDASDLCVGPGGGLFVADRENFCVQAFGPAGQIVKVIARFLNGRPALTNAPGGFMRPVSVAVDPSGSLFVLDTMKSTIDKFSNTLNVDASWQTAGSLHNASLASAVDMEYAGGCLYVLLPAGIMKFGLSGNLVEEFDLAGFSQDRLAAGARIAVAEGMIIVSDGNFVKFFDLESHSLFSLGGLSGDRDGELSSPEGVCLAGGILYVADSGNNRLQLFQRK